MDGGRSMRAVKGSLGHSPEMVGAEREWRLMISCARATRGLGSPSPGLMARLGVPVGGRVRKLRAVGDHQPALKGEGRMRAVKGQAIQLPLGPLLRFEIQGVALAA